MNIQDGTAKFRVRNKGTDRVPTGIVEFFAGSKAPKGWLVCDGSAVSRTDYDELFEVIGTTYGAGEGSTTFNLPNLLDRFAEGGKSVGTKKKAGLPNINSGVGTSIFSNIRDLDSYGGWKKDTDYGHDALYVHTWSITNIDPYNPKGGNGYDGQLRFNASRSNPIYGSSDTVQPPSLVLLPIIKY